MKTAYNNDAQFKERAVAAAMHHRDAEMLMAGTYGKFQDGFRGCSLGCDAFDITGKSQNDPHALTAEYFGFPEWLERLRDTIFEGLGADCRNDWHVDLKKAVPVGLTEKQFKSIKSKFIIYLMLENIKQVKSLSIDDGLKFLIIRAIEQIQTYHETHFRDESASGSASGSARSAAWSAAQSAGSAAESAARSAAWSAAESARSAAWSATAHSAQSAAESARSAAWSATAHSAQSAAESALSAAQSAAESARSGAQSAAQSARSAAWSAAQSARSGAWSAAQSAQSAAESARSAAWSATAHSAQSAAHSAANKKYADKLIELFDSE